jgi:cytochrome c biogenesis protein
MKQLNFIWNFFSSVKLAIFTLSFIALSSIIGTVIPQGEAPSFYVQKYGPQMAQFFQVLDIPDMYYSWWFTAFLGLLSANLIICSLDRFPTVLKIIKSDNLSTSFSKLEKMRQSSSWKVDRGSAGKVNIGDILLKAGWKPESRKIESDELFFSQKGAWSRTGVYMVHTSILVIFIGAIFGHFGGFKGNVMIPETRSSGKIYASGTSTPIELGFEVRCDSFAIEYYDNGMVKEYKSHLTVLEDGKEILKKYIEVNSPLTYKGITFYQSSYEGYQDFIVTVGDNDGGETKAFTVPFQKQQAWEEKDIRFGVVNAEAIGQRIVRSKLWAKAGDSPAVIEWVEDGKNITIKNGAKSFNLTAKQMYATGLQVSKDPGVWLVYLGCGLMLLGLYMAFFMSHKRIWLYQKLEGDDVSVVLAGSTNKNKIEFSKQFAELEKQIRKSYGV